MGGHSVAGDIFHFDLVWVPGFGMAPQTCFSVVSLSMRLWNSVRVRY